MPVSEADPSDSSVSIRAATAADAGAVRGLLRESKLPVDGVPDDLVHFLVAARGDVVVGTIGLERYERSALLRSAAVRATERGTGIGEALVNRLLDQARADSIDMVVLLTTTAEGWFPRFGFSRVDRSAVPKELHASAEFRGACPESAVAMALSLGR